jgi:thiol-disulfide isomerase/thioredoxin
MKTKARRSAIRLSAALLAYGLLGTWRPAAAATELSADFVGLTLEQEPVLLSKYAGKAVVLSFWATWCGYCVKELPILSGIQKAGKGNIQVIAVNTEERDVFREVVRLLHEMDIQLAYDPQHKARDAYGVDGIPHLVVIGRNGALVATFRGYNEKSLPAIIDAINLATGATKR